MVLIIGILFYSILDPHALTSNTLAYTVSIIAILAIMFVIYSSLFHFRKSPPVAFLIGGVVAIIVAIIVYFYYYITSKIMNYTGYAIEMISLVLLCLLLIGGLAITYKIFKNKIQNMEGWVGFFVNFIFFIPCMVTDGLEYFSQQYRLTPNSIFILFILEIVLLLVYLYVPKLINTYIKKSQIVLQNKPVFLNIETQVGNTNLFLLAPISGSSTKPIYKTNYAISMWTYINSKPSSDAAYVEETNIFDYGNGHPSITYKNTSDNTRKNASGIYTFRFSNTDINAVYETTITSQRWNFIVLNYLDSKILILDSNKLIFLFKT